MTKKKSTVHLRFIIFFAPGKLIFRHIRHCLYVSSKNSLLKKWKKFTYRRKLGHRYDWSGCICIFIKKKKLLRYIRHYDVFLCLIYGSFSIEKRYEIRVSNCLLLFWERQYSYCVISIHSEMCVLIHFTCRFFVHDRHEVSSAHFQNNNNPQDARYTFIDNGVISCLWINCRFIL